MGKDKTSPVKKNAAVKKQSAKAPVLLEKTSAADRQGPSLVIVESPAKERTISRFLKSGYVVRSSYGHVRDLPLRKIGVEIEDDFAPQYVVLPRAKKILAEFKALVAKCPYIYLATDHDREGESIAWHIAALLHLDSGRVRRITFHEITPGAIKEALAEPRGIDDNLVHAQQARRVIDRLVGYKLSPLLWAKIQSGLSAGRVQSVAVRLLSEREREIQAFESETFWTLSAQLEKPNASPRFEARLSIWNGERIETTRTFDLFAEQYRIKATTLRRPEDIKAVEDAVRPEAFTVAQVERKEVHRRPPPPFATSTMQQAASQKLGFAAERTMRVAQSLYEGVDLGDGEPVGLITYMRTDSFSISKAAIDEAARFLKQSFGAHYVPPTPPSYQTKSKGAQEAHEAIRPTSVLRTPDEVRARLNAEQAKLYDLIWRRFVASQMVEAVFDTVAADLQAGRAVFHCTGRTLKFDGFLRAWADLAKQPEEQEDEHDKDEEESALPALSEGDVVTLVGLQAEEHRSSPPPHYNEASLIRAMEKHGIGRPSTYAPTIKTIIDRGYVRRGLKDRKLIPSDLGMLVTEKLKKHFPDIVDLNYTAKVEERLDHIAEGKEPWVGVVNDFYSPFIKELNSASRTMEVSRVEPQKSDEICPVCSAPMLIRESRFGKYLSCSTFPKCKGKIQLTSDGQKVVLETTGDNCDLCGKALVIRTGRKGRFLACSGYPACKNTYSLDAEGKKIEGSRPLATTRKCNKCESALWLRKGKRGYFLACSGFPKCRNIKPVSRDEGEKLREEGERLRAELVAKRQAAAGTAPAA